ncbi:MAG: cell division protein FtsA, partial [Lachnospiraceae bacterium]|nr:cell division protein FtsA [Lachnospiraceae bacterium]
DSEASESVRTVTSEQPDDSSGAEQTAEVKPEIHPISVIVNKMPINLDGKSSYVFVDVFDYIDFDLSAAAGRVIVTRLNGRTAEYLEELHDGDVLEIYWQQI